MKERFINFLKTYWKMFAAIAALPVWLVLTLYLLTGDAFRNLLSVNILLVLPWYPVVFGAMTRKHYGMRWIPSILLSACIWLITLPFFLAWNFWYSIYLLAGYYLPAQISALITDLVLRLRKRQDEKDQELNLYPKDDSNNSKYMAHIDAYENNKNDMP